MEHSKGPRYVVGLARQLRRRQTGPEEILWACLRNRRLTGAKFRRQCPLGRYVADFYCHEAQLVIELQGGIHNRAQQREYDSVRRETIEQLGITLLIYDNERVTEGPDGVLLEIAAALAPRMPAERSPLSPKRIDLE